MYISNSTARKVVYLVMQQIIGIPALDVFFSLEDTISLKTPFALSMLCRSLIITNFRFSVQTIKGEGQPSFDTKIFLNLFVWVSKWSTDLES
jgi:uncharacterized membrane protein